MYHGSGKEFLPDNTQMTATYIHGMKKGYGEIKFSDGTEFRGNFENDEINGTGEYI